MNKLVACKVSFSSFLHTCLFAKKYVESEDVNKEPNNAYGEDSNSLDEKFSVQHDCSVEHELVVVGILLGILRALSELQFLHIAEGRIGIHKYNGLLSSLKD